VIWNKRGLIFTVKEKKFNHVLSIKTQREASKNNVGTKCHKRNVEVWCIYIINWGFIRKPAPYWLSYPCPMALKKREISKKDITTMEGKSALQENRA
jgi:hypothetical protein